MYYEAVLVCSGVVLGVLALLLVQYLILRRVWSALDTKQITKAESLPPTLNPELQDFLDRHPRPLLHQNDPLPEEDVFTLNMIFAFLFKEVRDTLPIRRWFLRMFDKDFQLLRESGHAGKIIKRLTIRDLNLGTSVPHIRKVAVMRPKPPLVLGEADELDVIIDLHYTGNFHMTVEADIALEKTSMVSITVTELTGKARLGFRHSAPGYTHPHYFFTFTEEPVLKIEVDAVLEGRSVQQINTLIANQMRRSIRKKHTWPNYKVRYKPFFPTPPDPTTAHLEFYGQALAAGQLLVKVLGGFGLTKLRTGVSVFCTLSLDNEERTDMAHKPTPADAAKQTLNIHILKAGSGGSIGVLFKEQGKLSNLCQIEEIRPGSPASYTNLRVGDVITMINGVAVISVKQALRLIKAAPSEVVLTAVRENTESVGAPSQREVLQDSTVTTKAVPVSKTPEWNEEFLFDVSADQTFLYARVYDCKLDKEGARKGKKFLAGFVEINLQEVALFCTTNQAAYRKRFQMRASPHPAAPPSGELELIIQHTPKLKTEAPAGAASSNKPANAVPTLIVSGDNATPRSRLSHSPSTSSLNTNEEAPAPSTASAAAASLSPQSSLRQRRPVSQMADTRNELFGDLPPEERKRELNALLNTVQNQIELEAETRLDFERQLEEAEDEGESPETIERLEANITASDERRELLYMRMLKCLSAIKSCEESLSVDEDQAS